MLNKCTYSCNLHPQLHQVTIKWAEGNEQGTVAMLPDWGGSAGVAVSGFTKVFFSLLRILFLPRVFDISMSLYLAQEQAINDVIW